MADEMGRGHRHAGQGDESMTPRNESERWLEFNDSSFFGREDSRILNGEEEEDANSQTFNFEARLGDLSCSLLDCDGGGQEGGTLEEGIVDNLIKALGKRDKTIETLNDYLRQFLNKKGDGDVILNSVEKNLENLADGLRNSTFLKPSTLVKKTVSINVASTQTECLVNEFEEIRRTPKSIRDFGTSFSPTILEMTNSFEEGSPIRFEEQGNKDGLDKHLSTLRVNTREEDGQVSPSDTDDDNNEGTGSSPKRRLSFAMNPDSLRLTFSPSICEYEAESYRAPHDSSGPAVEDLRLQVLDIERKLEAEKKFLSEMTLEREQEREEFQRAINNLAKKFQDVRREKEKLENTVEQQQLEINELEEHFREKELVEDQLMDKDCQLQQAVEKVFELREIIRGHEELIESMTKQSKVLLDSKQEASDVLEADSDLSETCNEIYKQENSCVSEDHAEELQTQVDELAKKIEEKLVELESFSWQNRPNSSCSGAGDDVSVRGTSARVSNCNDSTDARDFISRVFCGLRRLECSFDGLVRFEEVLVKKMKDAELKVGIDNKKIEALRAENGRLAQELNTCRQKIKDFEVFLKENKRRNHQESFSNHSIERLRNMGGVSFDKPFDSGTSPILRQYRNLRKDVDQSFPISTTEEMQQLEEVAFAPVPSAPIEQLVALKSSPDVQTSKQLIANESLQGALANPELAEFQSAPSRQASLESSKSTPDQSFDQTAGSDLAKEPSLKQIPSTASELTNEPSLRKVPSAEPELTKEPSLKKVPSAEPELTKEPSLKTVPSTEPELTKEPSTKKLYSETELPRAYSSHGFLNDAEPEQGYTRNEGLLGSDENTEPTPSEIIEVITISEFEIVDGNVTHLGSEILPEDGMIPSTPKESETDVLTIDNTIITDFAYAEAVEYPAESIIPYEDLNAPVESNDSQTSRLEGLDTILELEKIKTQLSQTQRALEAEKEKSQILEQTLNQFSANSYQQPTGDFSRSSDPFVEEEISRLVDDVKCQHQKYVRHMTCAITKINELQQDNDALRAQIERLESGDQDRDL